MDDLAPRPEPPPPSAPPPMTPLTNWPGLFALVLGLATLPAQQDTHWHRLDVSALLDRLPGSTVDLDEGWIAGYMPLSLPLALNGENESFLRRDLHTFPAPYVSPAALQTLIDDLPGMSGETPLLGGWLEVRADERLLGEVRNLLGALEGSLHQPLRAELHVYAKGPLPPAAILDASLADAWLERHEPEESFVQRMVTGVPARLCNRFREGMVRDYEVEVAESQDAADPKVDLFDEGRALGLFVQACADHRLFVTFALRESSIDRPMPTFAYREDKGGILPLPRGQVRILSSTTVLPMGGAIVIGSGTGAEGYCLLRLRGGAAGRRPFRTGNWQVLPLGGLQNTRITLAAVAPARIPGEEPPLPPEAPQVSASDRLEALTRAAGNPDSDYQPRFVADHLVLHHTEKDVHPLAGALIRRAQAQRGLTLRIHGGKVAAATAREYLAGRLDAKQLAAAFAQQQVLPTRADGDFVCTVGREQRYVKDFEVEISSSISAVNPIVDSGFSGLSLAGMLRARGRSFALDASLYHGDETFAEFDPKIPAARALGIRRGRELVRELRGLRLGDGRWEVLLLQPGPEGSYVGLALRVE